MANNSVMPCNCPRCNAPNGRSVASMNYAETQVWNKSGTFTGSGIGIGPGGIGVGFGGGRYEEEGKSATKRAAAFDEPGRAETPIGPIVLLVGLVGLGVMMAPRFSYILGGSTAGNKAIGSLPSWDDVPGWIIYVGIIAVAALALYLINRTKQHDDHHNGTVYPKQLARYQELRYCEDCHTLFDSHGNAVDALSLIHI